MSSDWSSEFPVFTICDDDGRGSIQKPVLITKYRPADEVYWVHRDAGGQQTRTGPYLVAAAKPGKKYTLCNSDGDLVGGGVEVEENNLELL